MNVRDGNLAITGGAGYIGSHLSRELLIQGRPHIVIDDLSSGDRSLLDSSVPFFGVSILDTRRVAKILKDCKIRTVVHLAALKSVAESVANPSRYFEVNETGTKTIVEAMKMAGTHNMVFSSTAAVYGEIGNDEAFIESHSMKPSNPYGQSKSNAELLLRSACDESELNTVVLRFFNVGGAISTHLRERKGDNVLSVLWRCVEEGTPFLIFGNDYETRDGTCIRDYVHVQELVRAKLRAISLLEKKELRGLEVVNLGSGIGFSVLELVREFEAVTGNRINVVYGGRREGDPAVSVADISKSKDFLGWSPVMTLADIVRG
jgi:UDP-glucose 4-epimerase